MDHVHDCPKCDGYFECDSDECSDQDLCLKCNRAKISQLEEKK